MEVERRAKTINMCFQKSRIKTMLITFYDSNNMVCKEFVSEGQTFNEDYYLQWLWSGIVSVRSESTEER